MLYVQKLHYLQTTTIFKMETTALGHFHLVNLSKFVSKSVFSREQLWLHLRCEQSLRLGEEILFYFKAVSAAACVGSGK